MLAHVPPGRHVESPARLRAVTAALADSDLSLETLDAPLADAADLRRVHSDRYLAALEQVLPAQGVRSLDGEDTWLSPGSLTAASRATGAAAAAVRRVASGDGIRAFCAVRPPGHHAGAERPMGFCVYANVAIGARVAQAAGLARVAVVDFDVHHGNGTQDILAGEPGVLFASIHQWPGWPGSGGPGEPTAANVVNAGVPPMAPRELWRRRFEGLMERVDAFSPDLILVSAGFDARVGEPLSDANQQLVPAVFAWATRAIVSVANGRAGGRVVSSLEGGYDLGALGRSAVAHVRALQGA